MDLTVKDIENLLLKSEKEIKNLIKQKDIPFQLINDKYYFNKQQVIEWALSKNITLNISNLSKLSEYKVDSLNSILEETSFVYEIEFSEDEYIDQMVALIDLDSSIDKSIIAQLLKKREELMSTAIGNGISLPHPRIPLMVGKKKPIINFFFPKVSLKLRSIDGKPVHTVILLISQTIKQHLSLIAHLSFLLSKETFRSALEQKLDPKAIIDIISQIENSRNG